MWRFCQQVAGICICPVLWCSVSIFTSTVFFFLNLQHNRDSLRFLVKGTRHIQCMLAVPGVVEVSQDFLETSSITAKYLESTVPGHNRKSRSEDEDFFQDTCTSNYTHLSEPIKEERAMLNTTLPRTKTSPVVCKELFKQDVQGTGMYACMKGELSHMPTCTEGSFPTCPPAQRGELSHMPTCTEGGAFPHAFLYTVPNLSYNVLN